MRALLLLTIALAGFGEPPAGPRRSGQEPPLACARTALTPQQRKRHFDELGPLLRKRKMGVRELADGYEFEFPADAATVQLVAEWAAGERLCCPFFDIELRLERGKAPLWLRLTGGRGTKDFIRAGGALWLHP